MNPAAQRLADQGFLDIVLGTSDHRDFFDTHWRRRFLHRQGAGGALLDLMPDESAVDELLSAPTHDSSRLVHAVSFPQSGLPATRPWALTPGEATVRAIDEPVNLPEADRYFPSLRPLAEAISRSFGAPAALQLFRAPPGTGLLPHRDLNDSFVIQIAGTKRWRCVDVRDARPDLDGNGEATLGEDPLIFDLEPGDVLYKPSHAAHATTSIGEATLSLTCSVATRTAGDLVIDAMRDRIAEDPVWLERVPFPAPDRGDDAEARPRLALALERLAASLPDLEALERQAQR